MEKTLGQKIREYRLKRGMTQEALAEKLFSRKSTVSEYENDKIDMKISILREIAKALGVPLSCFLCEQDEDADKYIRSAELLKDMRRDYEHFKSQLCFLGKDKDIFEKYLCRQKSLADIAEEQSITYESAQQKVHKIRRKLKEQVIKFMNGELEDIA